MCESINTSGRILDDTQTLNLDGEGKVRELVVFDYTGVNLGIKIEEANWLQPGFDPYSK